MKCCHVRGDCEGERDSRTTNDETPEHATCIARGVSCCCLFERFGSVYCLLSVPDLRMAGSGSSGFGLHLVQIESVTKGRLPDLAEIRPIVLREWSNAKRAKVRAQLNTSLLDDYDVVVEWPEVFAGALSNVGLPQTSIPMALLAFNVGVEAGQLVFVGAAIGACAMFRRVQVAPPEWVCRTPAYAIGSVAAFWMMERIAGF